MGGGSYDYLSRSVRTEKYASRSQNEIFRERNLNSQMSPKGVKVRESRDSKEHPNSFPIIIALDVTGSMGSIPTYLIKNGFPNLMKGIIDSGVADPQVLFLAIGDHECDQAPLQVGQFESSDELLDYWLEHVWLEGRGGGNDGESYHLAWYFAGYHTSTDSFEKRGKKGVLITVGDEKVLPNIGERDLRSIMGDGQYSSLSRFELLDKAKESWDCYHLHILEGNGDRQSTRDDWKQVIGDHLVMVADKTTVDKVISDIIIKSYNSTESTKLPPLGEFSGKPHSQQKEENKNSEYKPTTIL